MLFCNLFEYSNIYAYDSGIRNIYWDFMLLRTYAGGVHLNSFGSCFICSVTVQIIAMYFNSKYKFTVGTAWILILVSAILILKAAPVECINRELDDAEKEHCKK